MKKFSELVSLVTADICYIVGIGALLENTFTNEILFLRRNPVVYGDNLWDVVGGKLEQGEEIQECLHREIIEETGIENVDVRQIVDAFRWKEYQNEKDMIVLMYWCETTGNQIKLSDEHTEYKWIKPQKSTDLNIHPEMLRVVEKFVKAYSSPA